MVWTKGTRQSTKLQIFDCSREILPNFYFDRLLLLKLYKTSVEKVYASSATEEWCKTWRKTSLLFQKRQEFGLFWTEYSKFSKFPLLLVPFVLDK